MHHVAVVLRNPRCNHWIQLKIPHFYILESTYETYRSSLSKRKMTHSGDGGKKLSKDLAVTPENISWCLNPDFYGSCGGLHYFRNVPTLHLAYFFSCTNSFV